MTLKLHDRMHHNLYYIFENDKKLHPMPFKKVRFMRFMLNEKFINKSQKNKAK